MVSIACMHGLDFVFGMGNIFVDYTKFPLEMFKNSENSGRCETTFCNLPHTTIIFITNQIIFPLSKTERFWNNETFCLDDMHPYNLIGFTKDTSIVLLDSGWEGID